MKKDNELVISDDGSHTLVSDQFGVSYHSTHGAIQESITVFLAAGLHYAKQNFFSEINILEMGFGTGLNAILSLIEAEKYRIHISYDTIEAFPISLRQAKSLNYLDILNSNCLNTEFEKMHSSKSEEQIQLTKYFSFRKYLCKIEQFDVRDKFNVVYYDAFAPTTQPELWDEEMMKRIYEMLADQAVFVSYCAKGSFKRALKAAGFQIEPLPGPPGKREMTRAIKSL